ncbi:MAG: radical SAM protein [Chloroflexota bacterium]
MTLTFQEYQPRKIVNIHKHVDGPWFWEKYSAHPYVGCRSGCEFCYQRGTRYLGRRDPQSFDTLIGIKTNAIELLQKELSRLQPEVISLGDWQQPAETRYQLSRGMLKVVLERGFPVFIVERSPLITRDLDLLTEINRISWVGVLFSISNLDPRLKQAFEPRSPSIKSRLQAMEQLALAGIYTGTSMMPIIPHVGDDELHFDELIRATKDHGGRCVLASGLSMDGIQAERTLEAAQRLDPELEARFREMYNWEPGGKPTHNPPHAYSARMGLLVRKLCARHGIADRMPRYILPGPLAINKQIAERLFLKTYDLELEQTKGYQAWAYRKAAWTVDELGESIADIHRSCGEAGLREIPNIGKSLARVIAGWLQENRDG